MNEFYIRPNDNFDTFDIVRRIPGETGKEIKQIAMFFDESEAIRYVYWRNKEKHPFSKEVTINSDSVLNITGVEDEQVTIEGPARLFIQPKSNTEKENDT